MARVCTWVHGKWAGFPGPTRTGKWVGVSFPSRTGRSEESEGLAVAFALVELLSVTTVFKLQDTEDAHWHEALISRSKFLRVQLCG